MLKSLNVKKAHLFVLYMAGGLFLWHRNDYLNDIEAGALLFSPNTQELYELCDLVYKVRAGRVEDEIVVGSGEGSR